MASSSPPPDAEAQSQKMPAERIQELNTINEQVPQILHAAGQAIQALTNAPLPSSISSNPSSPMSSADAISAHKAAFQSSTHTFFTLVTAVANQLHTQAYALEAAGIIPAKEHRPRREPSAADLAEMAKVAGADAGSQVTTDPEASVTNSGLGELDVGWLNARASDVGKGMEAEVLGRVRKVLEGMAGEGKEQEKEDNVDESMQDA